MFKALNQRFAAFNQSMISKEKRISTSDARDFDFPLEPFRQGLVAFSTFISEKATEAERF